MTTEVQQAYLETQVTTAAPQQLRLLLIDGAIRFARQTREQWRQQQDEAALESLIRCRDIVSELIAGVRPDESPLARQVAALYGYLFSALTEAQQSRDTTQLAAVIRVLEEDRETWRQVCEQLAERPVPTPDSPLASREEVAPAVVAMPATSFSIDA